MNTTGENSKKMTTDYVQSYPPPGKSLRTYLLSGGAWAFSGKVTTALTGLIATALLARLLTPEAMGAYFLTLSLVAICVNFASLGLNQAVVRLVGESLGMEKPGRAKAAVKLVFRYAVVGSLVVAGILILGVGRLVATNIFNSSQMVKVVNLAAAWVIINTFQQLLAETFRGFRDIRFATIFGGLSTSIISAALFLLFWILQGYANLRDVVIISIAAGSTSIIFAKVLLQRKVGVLRDNGELNGQVVMAIAWPLLVTNLSYFAFTQADIWILGVFVSQQDVAIYGAAARLGNWIVMPLLLVNSVVTPLIAQMYTQGKKTDLEKVLRTTATLAGIPAFIVLVGFIFLGEPLLGLIYGTFYRGGAIVLALLSFGQIFNAWAGSCGLSLMMTGHQQAMMGITVICGITKVVLAILLVKSYETVGVAFAASAGLILQNLAMLFSVRIKTGMWTHISVINFCNLRRAKGTN